MKKQIITAALAVVLLGHITYAEEFTDFGATAKFGTLGFGLDATTNITEKVNLRFNINAGKVDLSEADKDYTTSGSFDLLTVGVVADYYPFENDFRLSGGLYYNNNRLDVTGLDPKKNVLIGDKRYDFTKDTKTRVNITTDTVAPYLGIGWGNAIKGTAWSFNLDVGVLYQGKPEAKISMSGTAIDSKTGEIVNINTDKTFKDNLDKERKKLKGDVDNIAFYPVVSVGVSYKF